MKSSISLFTSRQFIFNNMVEAAAPVITLTVSYAGQSHSLTFLESDSLEQLRNAIETATCVPPSNQKIIYKGKAITFNESSTQTTLSSLHLSNGAKLLLIGTKADSVSSLIKESLDRQRRFDVIGKRESIQPRKTPSGGKRIMDLNDLRRSGAGAFGSIEILQNCPHDNLRRERLVKLSMDEGVLGRSGHINDRGV